MAQAYDFSLDKMGMDILSYTLWTDYIMFLKSVYGIIDTIGNLHITYSIFCVIINVNHIIFREAIGSYAENQRITAVRKVYQRGVVNPMINIELLWKEYCTFENVQHIL